MKNIGKRILFLGVLLSVLVFGSCKQPASPENEWGPVTNKGDLVGTWKTEFNESGTSQTNIIYVGSDLSGYLLIQFDYSQTSEEYKAKVGSIIDNLESLGFNCDNDEQQKILTASYNFASDELDYLIEDMEINNSKTQIKLTGNIAAAIYTKI